MDTALFGLSNYQFPKAYLNNELFTSNELDVSFEVGGSFYQEKDASKYLLNIQVEIKCDEQESHFASVSCDATYQFKGAIKLEEIPEYFYQNSIAIIFPYVRAYLSLLTTQANVRPLIIPTLNLSYLSGQLKEFTKERKG